MSAYQLLVSRAKVTAGDEVLTERASVSVKDGIVTLKVAGAETITSPVQSVEKGRRSAKVTLENGTVWIVARAGCGCGGGR
jgi:predicted ThiF/HesA family dinucleotide-utilizing enzyme